MSWTATQRLAAIYVETRKGPGMVPPFHAAPIAGGWSVHNRAAQSLDVGALSEKFAADLAQAMNTAADPAATSEGVKL